MILKPIDFGPAFADYFNKQNAGITRGVLSGTKVDLIALGVSNGWYDPLFLAKSFTDFGYSNSYRSVINATAHDEYSLGFDRYCVSPLEACHISRSNSSCAGILLCLNGYNDTIISGLAAVADFYDIRLPAPSPEVSEAATTHEKYLWDPAVMAAIGARINYTYCSADVSADFEATGDCKILPLLPLPMASWYM